MERPAKKWQDTQEEPLPKVYEELWVSEPQLPKYTLTLNLVAVFGLLF